MLRFPFARGKDDTDGIQVEDFIEADFLGRHLVPDGIGRLDPLADDIFDAGFIQHLPDGIHESLDIRHTDGRAAFDAPGNVRPLFGPAVAQPGVLHLRFDAVKSQPVCQRDKNVHNVRKDLVAFARNLGFQGPATVQAVCEFDQDDAHVVAEGQQDLPEIFRLQVLRTLEFLAAFVVKDILDFHHPLHQRGDGIPEEAADIFHLIAGVFKDIVQECGTDGFIPQADFADDDLGDFNRMDDIRLPGTSADVLVGFADKFQRPLDGRLLFRIGTALAHERHQRFPGVLDLTVILYGEFRETHSSIL